ncbi:MAG: LysM peptidoglycan-binding domain-containing protein [Verrucomicrobia bacterium]|nr:LysM peptidoglycan-binding domain-containing protein [Verrucomicrobiota bacterium]
MEMEPFENPWIKKIRLLTHVTLWSVTLNVGLALLLFFSFRDKKNERLGKSLVKEVRLKESNTEVLVHYFSASFTDLVGELYDMTLLQDGYRKRDLALACLVNYHYFAIEKALPCLTLPKRRLAFIHKEGGEIFELLAFPGLEDRHFQMITQYIAEERWPLTGEGLFLELKKTGSNAPQTLQAAFFATPDFQSLYTILTRGEERLLQLEALTILLEGSFDVVSSFIGKPPTIETMRAFLQKYVEIGSKKAAHLWLRIDSEYVLRNMDDKLLIRFISLLEESTVPVQLTLKSLLASVRSDALRKEAALKLYSLAGEKPPAPYDHAVAIKRFIPTYVETPPVTVQPVVLQEVKPKTKTPSKKIVVEAGDSLWKLARKHHTTIEVLKDLNQLDSDRLRPGQALFIP